MISILSSRLGIRREVRLRESSLIRTPILFGWFKPVILTPLGLLAQLSNSQLEALLAHELGHVRRSPLKMRSFLNRRNFISRVRTSKTSPIVRRGLSFISVPSPPSDFNRRSCLEATS